MPSASGAFSTRPHILCLLDRPLSVQSGDMGDTAHHLFGRTQGQLLLAGMGPPGGVRVSDAARRAARGADDRNDQSGRHLGGPISPGRVEAVFPINASSGRDVGVRAQAHLYLSEIFPDTIGRPIFGK
jgi:hypothetical protein